SSEWQVKTYRFAYHFNHSLQDNRQKGRELADLSNFVNGFSVGLPALGRVDLTFDLNDESANNREKRRTDRTLRFVSNVNWRMTKQTLFTAAISTTGAGDLAGISHSRNLEADLQWSYKFLLEKSHYRKLQGQFFIRYS